MAILKKRNISLRTRITTAFVFVIIVTITILSVANHYRWYNDYIQQARDEGLILVQTLAQSSIDPIIKHDFFTLNQRVQTLIQKESVIYIVISDKNNQVLVQSESALALIPPEILGNKTSGDVPNLIQTYMNPRLQINVNDIQANALIDNRPWGRVRIGFSLEHLDREVRKNIYIVLATGLISIVIGIGVAFVLSRLITGPIEKFIHSMRTIADGDLQQEIQIETMDEFGALAKTFNHMSYSLRANKEELQQTYQRLIEKEKMAALGELAARIAHEIKNPLSIIKGSAQIFVDKRSDPVIKAEVGEYIIEEINRLSGKVRVLLDHAKPHNKNLKAIDINSVLEDSIQFWESQKNSRQKIKINRRFSDRIPPLMIDNELIRQIALNMIINSCDAMQDGGMITVETDIVLPRDMERLGIKDTLPDTRYTVLRFEDTGIGIPPADLPKVLEPFFTTKKNGTGLGLSNVNRIVENYQGKILVENIKEKGARFSIFLPST
ncbi:MAG: ATP-binding protein [Proteobacteria bacterium]|nr:ATP-binding protein [Pseudomonadota bacterium]